MASRRRARPSSCLAFGFSRGFLLHFLFGPGLGVHALRQLRSPGLPVPLFERLGGDLALHEELGELPPLRPALERHPLVTSSRRTSCSGCRERAPACPRTGTPRAPGTRGSSPRPTSRRAPRRPARATRSCSGGTTPCTETSRSGGRCSRGRGSTP